MGRKPLIFQSKRIVFPRCNIPQIRFHRPEANFEVLRIQASLIEPPQQSVAVSGCADVLLESATIPLQESPQFRFGGIFTPVRNDLNTNIGILGQYLPDKLSPSLRQFLAKGAEPVKALGRLFVNAVQLVLTPPDLSQSVFDPLATLHKLAVNRRITSALLLQSFLQLPICVQRGIHGCLPLGGIAALCPSARQSVDLG